MPKFKGEQYQLSWAGRAGFARVAIDNGYPIVRSAWSVATISLRRLADLQDVRDDDPYRNLNPPAWSKAAQPGEAVSRPLSAHH